MANVVNILVIEHSPGVAGSTISLCHLLNHCAAEKMRFFVVFSRRDQEAYWESRAKVDAATTVIRRGNDPRSGPFFRRLARWGDPRHPRFVRAAAQAFGLLDFILNDLPYVIRILAYCRNRRIDVVVHNNAVCAAAIVVSKLLGTPLVVMQRGSEWQSRMMRMLARGVTIGVANSEATRKELSRLGIPEQRLRIVYPPVDTQRFNRDIDGRPLRPEFGVGTGTRCFGIVGQLIRWKGQDTFLRAAHMVLRKVPNALAFVVGEAPEGNNEFEIELKRLAAELGISESVVFTGFRSDTPQVMKMLDVIVHASSLPEPFGRVIVEAMAVGRPVVATGPGGPSEIIRSGDTGFLVEPGDPAAMAERINELLEHPELASRMGERAAADVNARFSATTQASRFSEILFEACTRRDSV